MGLETIHLTVDRFRLEDMAAIEYLWVITNGNPAVLFEVEPIIGFSG